MHYDRAPRGEEELLFTSTPASEWNEDWVAIDGNDARWALNRLLDGFDAMRRFPFAS